MQRRARLLDSPFLMRLVTRTYITERENLIFSARRDRMRVLLLLRVFFNYVNDLSIQFGFSRRF